MGVDVKCCYIQRFSISTCTVHGRRKCSGRSMQGCSCDPVYIPPVDQCGKQYLRAWPSGRSMYHWGDCFMNKAIYFVYMVVVCNQQYWPYYGWWTGWPLIEVPLYKGRTFDVIQSNINGQIGKKVCKSLRIHNRTYYWGDCFMNKKYTVYVRWPLIEVLMYMYMDSMLRWHNKSSALYPSDHH